MESQPIRLPKIGRRRTSLRATIAAERLTVPGLLKQHGYHTACIGKWHLGFTIEGAGKDGGKGKARGKLEGGGQWVKGKSIGARRYAARTLGPSTHSGGIMI